MLLLSVPRARSAIMHKMGSLCIGRSFPLPCQGCWEHRETLPRPSARSGYRTRHNLISFGPLWKDQAALPPGAAMGEPLSPGVQPSHILCSSPPPQMLSPTRRGSSCPSRSRPCSTRDALAPPGLADRHCFLHSHRRHVYLVASKGQAPNGQQHGLPRRGHPLNRPVPGPEAPPNAVACRTCEGGVRLCCLLWWALGHRHTHLLPGGQSSLS